MDDVLQYILSKCSIDMKLIPVHVREGEAMRVAASSLRFLDTTATGPGPVSLSLVSKRFYKLVRQTPALWRFTVGRPVSSTPSIELTDAGAIPLSLLSPLSCFIFDYD